MNQEQQYNSAPATEAHGQAQLQAHDQTQGQALPNGSQQPHNFQDGVAPQEKSQSLPQTGEWDRSLFTWPGCVPCWSAACVPCFGFGRTSERLVNPTLKGYDDDNAECTNMAWLQCLSCGWVYAARQRAEIRERFGIKGSKLGDHCSMFWCQCFALPQQDHEVEKRLGGVDARGYQANTEGMQVPQAQGEQQQQHYQQTQPTQAQTQV